jgi:hypothetical protein
MIAPELTLNHLGWEELLTDINFLMEQEAARLAANKAYYKKLYYSENPNQGQLRKFYDRLTEEQQRFDFFSELLNRLQTFNALALLQAIDHCEQSEKKINGKVPSNFQIIISKQGEKISSYYLPLK